MSYEFKLVILLCIISYNLCYFTNLLINNPTNRFTSLKSATDVFPNQDILPQQLESLLPLLRQINDPSINMSHVEYAFGYWCKPVRREFLRDPLIVAGASGVGKGRIIKEILGHNPWQFHKVVWYTTRPPCYFEINGTSSHFITEGRFRELRKQDQFLLWYKNFDGFMYGLPNYCFQEAFELNKVPIIEISTEGALKLMEIINPKTFDVRPIYLLIKSAAYSTRIRATLSKRYDKLNIDPKFFYEELENALKENSNFMIEKWFDRVIINKHFQSTILRVYEAIHYWYGIPSAKMFYDTLKKVQNVVSRYNKNNTAG